MPTVLRQFPQQNRSGQQQTAYAQLPPAIDYIELVAQASDATFSDTANAITFIVLVSPTGSDVDAKEIQREYWTGGTFFNRFATPPATEPKRININFNLETVNQGQFIALRAIFNRMINIGATLTGLP
jgi:hypothetical protein